MNPCLVADRLYVDFIRLEHLIAFLICSAFVLKKSPESVNLMNLIVLENELDRFRK